ncbi:MAG: tetratricopeptide repeat protein, partial [Rhodothermaceae bacterium]|nr:tetratricopeptide repeat protein [Rhodothermaceae bacterium]
VEDSLMPSWGHAHAHMRLGIAYMDQRELEKARSSFEQALEINPDFGWVKDELIPSLEELESEN